MDQQWYDVSTYTCPKNDFKKTLEGSATYDDDGRGHFPPPTLGSNELHVLTHRETSEVRILSLSNVIK